MHELKARIVNQHILVWILSRKENLRTLGALDLEQLNARLDDMLAENDDVFSVLPKLGTVQNRVIGLCLLKYKPVCTSALRITSADERMQSTPQCFI